jgi:hypothetical protein
MTENPSLDITRSFVTHGALDHTHQLFTQPSLGLSLFHVVKEPSTFILSTSRSDILTHEKSNPYVLPGLKEGV